MEKSLIDYRSLLGGIGFFIIKYSYLRVIWPFGLPDSDIVYAFTDIPFLILAFGVWFSDIAP